LAESDATGADALVAAESLAVWSPVPQPYNVSTSKLVNANPKLDLPFRNFMNQSPLLELMIE
jgi:hypothetical protein